jgi:hypothetical protein
MESGGLMSSPTAPGDYPTHQLNTLFLRVPFGDWTKVTIGAKVEFRTKPRGNAAIHLAQCPTPVVAYTVNSHGARACKLMVLVEQRQERLIDIADKPLHLEREGFTSYDEFKRYWRARNGGIYRPLQTVITHRLREWEDDDDAIMGTELCERLYGEFMPPSGFSAHVVG